ncbi:MAG: apolipoprotein N-acyltransferase [Planctomycetes bacterium]|nr:apolipoprotein N-acyltransferase [Planctomycetota bacterium]
MTSRFRLLPPFLSSLLLWLSFHPADFGFLAWIALVPFMAWAATEPKGWRAFLVGWAAGFCFHTAAFWWITYTAPVIGPIGLGVYKGLYWAVFAAALRWAVRGGFPLTITAPVLWVALEFARAYALGGLPFWILGYAAHRLAAFIQVADIGGIWWVTFVVALINATLARAFVPSAKQREIRWAAAVSIAVLLVSVGYGIVRLATIELEDGPRIGIVQANIPQDIKEIAKGHDLQERMRIYREHMELTRALVPEKPDLIVWPEVALLDEVYIQGETWVKEYRLERGMELAQSPASETGIPTVLGIIVVELPPGERIPDPIIEHDDFMGFLDRGTFTNSALYFDGQGRPIGRFDKIKLVPFSEKMLFSDFLPVDKVVAWFLKVNKVYEFRRGTRRPVFEHPKGRFAVSICSENYYPEISREFARKGAGIIVNISNDGWFRESAELDAQMVMAKFRAVENRVHYVRATNTGISALIEPTGRLAAVVEGSEGNRKGVAGARCAVARVTRSASPYRALGDWAAWLCAGLCVGGLVARKLRRAGSLTAT